MFAAEHRRTFDMNEEGGGLETNEHSNTQQENSVNKTTKNFNPTVSVPSIARSCKIVIDCKDCTLAMRHCKIRSHVDWAHAQDGSNIQRGTREYVAL